MFSIYTQQFTVTLSPQASFLYVHSSLLLPLAHRPVFYMYIVVYCYPQHIGQYTCIIIVFYMYVYTQQLTVTLSPQANIYSFILCTQQFIVTLSTQANIHVYSFLYVHSSLLLSLAHRPIYIVFFIHVHCMYIVVYCYPQPIGQYTCIIIVFWASGSEPTQLFGWQCHLYLFITDRPFWPPGGPALRANVCIAGLHMRTHGALLKSERLKRFYYTCRKD